MGCEFGARQTTEKEAQTDQSGYFKIHKTLFIISLRREQADWRDHQCQRSALSGMLRQTEQQNQRRNDNYRSPNTDQAAENTGYQSQKQIEKYVHNTLTSLHIWPAVFATSL